LNAAAQGGAQGQGLDVRLFASSLWERRWWIAATILVFSAGFTAAAFLTTPVYRASTVLVPASSGRGGTGSLTAALEQFGGLAALAGISSGSAGSAAEESIAVLRSRAFTEAFISDEQLMPELFHSRWDAPGRRWMGDARTVPTSAQAFKIFDKLRTVSRDNKTGLITVQVDWRDPELAARWANELVARVNAEMRARAIEHADAAVGYLNSELAATTVVETREAINRLLEAQINLRMLANVTREYAFRVVDKALPPDRHDSIRPQRLLLLVAGPCFGFWAGVLGVLALGAIRRPASQQRLAK
jgi:uncharacterized protein involved in exopolysaccharide biosynthesis